MTEVTPQGIVKWTQEDPASIVQESQAQGDSIDAALQKRQRYDYVWANSAERAAQTGMVQGSRGYQVDLKAEYLFDNSNWRLSASYIELTSTSAAAPTGTAVTTGTFTVNTTNSTDTNFVTPSISKVIIANPGIYSIQLLAKETGNNPCTGQSQIVISDQNSFGSVPGRLSNGMFAGALMATAVLPFLRVTAASTEIFFYFFNDSGANRTVDCKVSIGRLA